MPLHRITVFLCLCVLSVYALASSGCEVNNNVLNVKSGQTCNLSENSAYESVDARGTLIIGEDVIVLINEGFNVRADLDLKARSRVQASRILISDSTVTMGPASELRAASRLHLFENVNVDAPLNGILSAQQYEFGHNIALNSISYEDYVPRFIRSSTSFRIPTATELVATLDASLMLLENNDDNPSPTAQKHLYQQLFTSQVQTETCRTVYVEVKETLDTVYTEFEAVVEEASELSGQLAATEEEVEVCGNLLGACEIYVYENKYDSTLPSPIPIPDENDITTPMDIPADLTFRYVLQVEKATDGTITEEDLIALEDAIIDQLATKLAVPKTSVIVDDVSLLGNDVIFSTRIVTPALASLAFAQETGVRLNAVPAQVLFEDIPQVIPSFSVHGGQTVAHETFPYSSHTVAEHSSASTGGQSMVIVSAIVGAVCALVGAVVATIIRERRSEKVHDIPRKNKSEKEPDSIDVNVGVTQLKL